MTTTKQSWFKRSLAVLLAVMMVMSMGITNVFAQTSALSVNVTDVGETEATLTITDNNSIDASVKYAIYRVQDSSIPAPSVEDLKQQSEENKSVTMTGNNVSAKISRLNADTEYTVYALILSVGSDWKPVYTDMVSTKFETLETSEPIPESEVSLSYRQSSISTPTTIVFETIEEAINVMNGLDDQCVDVTLTLLEDININVGEAWESGITINRTATLDLAGHLLTVNGSSDGYSYGIYVEGDITFTIKDSSANQSGVFAYRTAYTGVGICIGSNKVPLPDDAVCDVGFILESGNISALNSSNGSEIYALSVAEFADAKIENGNIRGLVSLKGLLTINGGKIEATSDVGVIVMQSTGRLHMTEGTVANTGGNTSLISRNAAITAYTGLDETGTINISGGLLVSKTGPALSLSNRSGNRAKVNISGDTTLESGQSAAIYFVCSSASAGDYYNITVGGTVSLRGHDYAVALSSYEKGADFLSINIQGETKLAYNLIPVYPNSSYVTYPDGMVPNVIAEDDGTYRLVESSSLTQQIGNLECGYQYLDDLKTVLDNAQSIYATENSANTYDTTLWTTFAKAYEAALPILNNKNANQNEIDYFTDALGKAQAEMIADAESGINLENLADGVYKVNVEMWNYAFTHLSMANGAVNGNAQFVVKDGKGPITLEFKPIQQLGYWGSLMQYWVYDGDTPEEAQHISSTHGGDLEYLTEAEYPAYHVVDFNSGVTTPIQGKPAEMPSLSNEIRPASAQIQLPYIGNTGDENKIYCYVGVDMMRSEDGSGVGDQPVILYIKYSTLEAVDVQPTLSLSAYELSMMVGEKETVTATLKGADGYAVTKWESSNPSVAAVDNGQITAVGEGKATITVTATKDGAESLTKTITVTVAPEGSEAVKVEKVDVSGNTETAILTGNFLTSGGADGIAVNGNTVTIDAKSDGSNITSSKVVIPQETAQALAGKTVVVETSTGSISLNSTLLAQIAGVNGGVTLSIGEAAVPVGLGTFSSAYEISLVAANGDAVEFGEGQATVTVTSEETVNYAYCIDNGQRTERVATSTSGNSVSFTVSHFSLWALSDREYEVGGSASTGFFLEDGNYYVDIDLWKSDSNEASMGNVAFKNNDKALVTVKDGKITKVQIGTNPVDIDPYHSAIISFELADGTKVKIEAKGDLTTIPANKDYTYIKLVSFNLPDSAQPDIKDAVTYVPVNFYVPDTPMDAAVGETLTARLRFTWSTAVKTNDTSLQVDDTTAAGDSPITGEEIVDVNLVDEATGIKLETNSGILSDKAVLSVEKLTQGADYDIAMKAMNGVDGSWNLYKITALVDGVETAPLGSVVLYIPCGAEGMTLYRVNTDGTKTLVRGEVQDGYYVVRTTSLGLFAMVGEAAGTPGGTQDGNQNSNTNIPQTGDNSNVAVYALLALAAAGMMGVALVTRKRKAEEK